MNGKRIGRRTVALRTPPSVLSFANIGGRMEGHGPLAKYFDELCEDSFFGEKTWEKAESAMQERVLRRALEQAGLAPDELDYVLAGDLLNQCIGSSFGLRDFSIPFFGLYGACSTMGESLALAAMLIDGGFAEKAAAQAASGQGGDLMSKVVEINGVKVLAAKLDASNIKAMRELMDDIRSKMPSGVACIAAPVDEGKVSMILYVSKDLHGRFTAPALIKEVAAPIAGSGGGRPDQAQAGGTNPEGIDEAMDVLKAKIGE